VQAVVDGVFATVNEVEESTDFGEGEGDKTSMGGCGLWCGWIVGWGVLVV
jgi:hypothetical protein